VDPLEADRRRLEQDLMQLERREAELRKIQEKTVREMEILPGRIAEHRKKQLEIARVRDLSTASDGSLGSRRGKRMLRADTRRMTSREFQSARLQFLTLCVVFLGLLVLLWKSVR
jgi:C4-dicarboxylate-specific signal transduction histidine kinase